MLKEFWRIVRYGIPVVKNKVEASYYWKLFFKAGAGAVSLTLLGGLLGVVVSHYTWAGPEVGRRIIFFSGFFSSLIFVFCILLEDFILSVLIMAFPGELISKSLEEAKDALNKTLWLWLAWVSFIMLLFFVLGVYAPKFTIMLGVLSLLLVFLLGPDNQRFIKIARFVCYSSFIYCILGAIPPHVWIFTAGYDFSPIIRLESALGDINAVLMEDLKNARLERKKELCSQKIIEQTKRASVASWQSLKDAEKDQKNMEADCGSPPPF